MQWIQDFIRNCPQIVVSGPVPMAQIIEKLKQDYNAEELPLEQCPPRYLRMYQQNAYYYAQDEKINLSMEDIRIKVLRVPVTDETGQYTEKDFVTWWIEDTEDRTGIYIAYEERCGYFYCNSSKLHLELTLTRGIPEQDIQDKTEKYQEYVCLMKRYIENYTDMKI